MLKRNKPQAGAGGAHSFLCLDTNASLNFLILHLLIAKCCKHPTMDLT